MNALLDYGSDSEESGHSDKEGAEDTFKQNNKTETSCDFFGLCSTQTTKSTSQQKNKALQVTATKKNVIDIASEKVQVDLPSTSFWKDASLNEVQILQQSSKYDGGDVEDTHHLIGPKWTRNKHFVEFHKRASDTMKNHIKRPRYKTESKLTVSQNLEDTTTSRKRKIYFIHPKIAPLLHSRTAHSKLPTSREWSNPGHAGAANRVKWNIPNYSHLLATCSMDSTIKVWNIWSQLDPCVQLLRVHSKAVRDVNWSSDGKQLLSCSYDRTANLIDVDTGSAVQRFEHTCYVTCCKYHPMNQHLCVTGGNKEINVWDCRSPSVPCRAFTYKDSFGQVQDLLFTSDGCQLFSSSDLVSRDSADRNLMAWDFATGTVLSNQIYEERYTVTRLALHPSDNQFLAQSNGNYIAIFSLQQPYKMNKHKRFEGHKVEGYSIGFDVSLDGQLVYSGSADGKVNCYSYQTSKILRTVSTGLPVVMDVACHPVLPSTIAVCSWDGTVQVWR